MVRTGVVEARRKKVEAYILNRPKEYISSMEACKQFGVSDTTFRNDVKAIAAALGGAVETVPGQGIMYIPVAKEPSLEEELIKAFGSTTVNKNAEGYPDPTASAAIEKVDAEQRMKKKELSYSLKPIVSSAVDTSYLARRAAMEAEAMPKPGEVWECDCSSGRTDLMLIVRAYDTFCSVLKLYSDNGGILAIEGANSIIWDDMSYSISASAIGTKPNKYIKQKKFCLDRKKFDDICDSIAKIYQPAVSKRDEQALEELEKELNDREKRLDKFGEELYEREKNLEMQKDEIDMLRKDLEAREGTPEELIQLRTKVEIYERLIFRGN